MRWRRGPLLNDGRSFAAIQPALLTHADDGSQILCRTRQGAVGECWSEDGGESWTPLTATELPNPDSGIDAVTLASGQALLVYNHSHSARTPLNMAISDDGRHWSALGVLEDEPGEFSYPAFIQDRDGTVHVTYTWNRRRIRHLALSPSDLAPGCDPTRSLAGTGSSGGAMRKSGFRPAELPDLTALRSRRNRSTLLP
jgi:predicted neuraminidase